MNIALIGFGRIAKKHIEAIKKNNLNLVAICEINKNKWKDIGVKFYTDYNEMIKNENIDIISVLTPSGFHYKNSLDLLKYKIPLIIEKPITLRYDEAQHLIKEAQKNKVRIFTVKQNRFNLPIVKLKQNISKLGKLVLGNVRVRWCRTQEYYNLDSWRGTWKLDGGVLSNQAIHHIDLIQWIMGEVESVYAKSITRLVDIEVEDTAIVTLKFKNGALGIIEATTATRPKDIEGSLSVLGENGSVEIGGFAVNKLNYWNIKDEKIDINKFSENPPNIYGYGHITFYKDVVNSLKTGKKGVCEAEEGIKSIKLMNAMYESIETNKEIWLDNFKIEKARIGK